MTFDQKNARILFWFQLGFSWKPTKFCQQQQILICVVYCLSPDKTFEWHNEQVRLGIPVRGWGPWARRPPRATGTSPAPCPAAARTGSFAPWSGGGGGGSGRITHSESAPGFFTDCFATHQWLAWCFARKKLKQALKNADSDSICFEPTKQYTLRKQCFFSRTACGECYSRTIILNQSNTESGGTEYEIEPGSRSPTPLLFFHFHFQINGRPEYFSQWRTINVYNICEHKNEEKAINRRTGSKRRASNRRVQESQCQCHCSDTPKKLKRRGNILKTTGNALDQVFFFGQATTNQHHIDVPAAGSQQDCAAWPAHEFALGTIAKNWCAINIISCLKILSSLSLSLSISSVFPRFWKNDDNSNTRFISVQPHWYWKQKKIWNISEISVDRDCCKLRFDLNKCLQKKAVKYALHNFDKNLRYSEQLLMVRITPINHFVKLIKFYQRKKALDTSTGFKFYPGVCIFILVKYFDETIHDEKIPNQLPEDLVELLHDVVVRSHSIEDSVCLRRRVSFNVCGVWVFTKRPEFLYLDSCRGRKRGLAFKNNTSTSSCSLQGNQII